MLGLTLNKNGLKTASDINLLSARLERLFFTQVGTAIGFLDNGSRILDYFWEGDTPENAKGILSEVKFLLMAHETSFVPIDILVKFIAIDGYTALLIEINGSFEEELGEIVNLKFVKIKD